MGGEFFFVWFLLAGGVAWLASSRGRSGVGFFLLSAVLSPLLGLIVVLVTKNLVAEEAKEDERRREEAAREAQRKKEHELQIEQIRAVTTAAAAKPGPSAARSVADEIEKLGALKEKGLLTDDEFQAQKASLLRT